jgi:hypothetical protein
VIVHRTRFPLIALERHRADVETLAGVRRAMIARRTRLR